MPEGDTVFRTAEKLREALAGRTLTRCDIRVPRYATVDLSGHRVDGILIERIDGVPALESAGHPGAHLAAGALVEAGFTRTPRGFRLRRGGR